MASVDLRQITSHDVLESSTHSEGTEFGNYEYITLNSDKLGGEVTKMGYICESRGIGLPIFITANNVEKKFVIGKTGILELQPEGEVIIQISQVKIPMKKTGEDNFIPLEWKLDYIVAG